LAIAVDKEGLLGQAGLTAQQYREQVSRLWPEWTEAFLLALPDEAHVRGCLEADRSGAEVEGLLDARTRVV